MKSSWDFNGVYGECRFGSLNADGLTIFDLCAAANLQIIYSDCTFRLYLLYIVALYNGKGDAL